MREEIAQHRHRTPRHPISRRMPERLHPASAVGKDREVTSCRGLACYLHARNFHEIGEHGMTMFCRNAFGMKLHAMNGQAGMAERSEEHTSELQSLMRISYAVFCLKNQKNQRQRHRGIQEAVAT